MYGGALFVHSVLRWLVLLLGLLVVFRALAGRSSGRPWTAADEGGGLLFILAVDLQFVAGLLLFLFSPVTTLGTHELNLAWQSPVLRFFTLVHPVLMVVAFVMVHIARVRIRRAAAEAHRMAAAWFGVALAIMIAATPWPFLSYGRPLLSWWR